MLAAGSRFRFGDGRAIPPYLCEVNGSLVLEQKLAQLASLPDTTVTLAVTEEDARDFGVSDLVKVLNEDCHIFPIANKTAGALCTALLAIDNLDRADDLLITNVTDLVSVDHLAVRDSFRLAGNQAGAIVFESVNPRYSFVRIDDDGNVLQAAEKRAISRHATTGVYWFETVSLFEEMSFRHIVKSSLGSHPYYVCPVLNEIILAGGTVGSFAIDSTDYHPIKDSSAAL